MTRKDMSSSVLSNLLREIGDSSPLARLVVVSKSQPAAKIRQAAEEGQKDFGENYAQEFLEHVAACADLPELRWHFIGHLQRNKVKSILPHAFLIHSVDSYELLKEIDKRAAALEKTQDVLVEVKLSSEETKTGLPIAELEDLLRQANGLSRVKVKGLMAVPPFFDDPEKARPYFRRLGELKNEMNEKKVYQSELTELSMGMSHDYRVALEEGATWIRIGTKIFGARS